MRSSDRSFLRPGLAAGGLVALGAWIGLSGAAGGLVVLFAGLFLLPSLLARLPLGSPAFRRLGHLGGRGALAALLLLLGLVAGKTSPRAERVPLLDEAALAGEGVRFAGRLAEPVTRRLKPPRWLADDPQLRYTLLIDLTAVEKDGEWHPVRTRALLGAAAFPLEARAGDAVEGRALLFLPRPPRNPGEDDGTVRLARAGVGYVGALQKGALAPVAFGSGPVRTAESFRLRFAQAVEARLGPGDRAGLVTALAVGERGGITHELSEAFSTAGLAHLLALSGLHLAVAVASLFWLLRRLFGLFDAVASRVAPRRLAAAVCIPLTLLYVVTIGAPPAAVRAGLGMGLFFLGSLAGRRPDTLNTLGWCLCIVALIEPAALGLVSTQLSFMGVLGIAWLTPRLRALVPLARPDPTREGIAGRLGRMREALLMMVLVSTAATITTAPVTAVHFERAALISAISNVVAWPASAVVVPAGALAAVLFSFAPTLAGPLIDLAGLSAWALAECARFFAAWPAASVHVAPPTALQLVFYGALVVGAASLTLWSKRRSLALGSVGAVGLLVLSVPATGETGKLEITFLAVGQGDGMVLRFPRGTTMVFDAGGEISGRFDPGARIVAPYLRHVGAGGIDHMVLSHPHPDHMNGLHALFERFPVGELWHNGEGAETGPLARLLQDARKAGTRLVEFRQGLPDACPELPPLEETHPLAAELAVGDPRCAEPFPVLDIDGVRVEVLHPLSGPDRSWYPELNENDNSLVLRLVHGDVRILLPGDLEHDGEALLLARGVDLSADLLKAPHHGSKTSSTAAFLEAVRPKHVVYCVGENNMFGFPSPSVDERYQAMGVTRHRTDRHGAITVVSDGRKLRVSHYRSAD